MKVAFYLLAILILGLAFTTTTSGCGGASDSAVNSSTNLNTEKTWPGQGQTRLYVRTINPDSQTIYDEKGSSLSQDQIKQLLSSSLKQGTTDVIEIGVLPENSPNPPDLSQPSRWGFNVGDYRVMVRWEDGYVGGCIKRKTWRHLNFQIKNRKNNDDLFNWHATGWWENGPQVGLYNSASGWCATSRGTWTEIKNGIAKMLMDSAHIPSWPAYAIAAVAATITVAAFAF